MAAFAHNTRHVIIAAFDTSPTNGIPLAKMPLWARLPCEVSGQPKPSSLEKSHDFSWHWLCTLTLVCMITGSMWV
jgi:hypothetical protein